MERAVTGEEQHVASAVWGWSSEAESGGAGDEPELVQGVGGCDPDRGGGTFRSRCSHVGPACFPECRAPHENPPGVLLGAIPRVSLTVLTSELS